FVLAIAIGALWARSYLPDDIEAASIDCPADTPTWTADSPLKVLSYNVQYMASKNYVFFYDVDLNNEERVAAVTIAGKTLASQPAKEHVFWTLDKVADVIRKEDPDVILLQEINGREDSRTYYTDQGAELLARLPADTYLCQTEAPYWKAEFVFHPEVLGPVHMKLLTLSKYRITKSLRHQLPRKSNNVLVTPFDFQRALLESHIATEDNRTVALINTHFAAWGAGTGIMDRQVARTMAMLESLDSAAIPWVLGGDLNLLPPDNNRQRQRIHAAQTGNFDETPQISLLYEKYRGVPSVQQLRSANPEAWYTHFPNDPTVSSPDRTIDYLFYSDQWSLDNAYVLQGDALQISDHLPVIGVYSLPVVSD
ncbi:MAG: endonuclease/exonuclease/phosphatase family protein, partial [Woeseiaceae bacterium]|nr:endonuclease/exonuclease/phosphatase family protein [Woeseiaceae bacterium]